MNLFTMTGVKFLTVYKKATHKIIVTLLFGVSLLTNHSFAQAPSNCTISVSDAHTDALCPQANGTLTISFSGGTAPYQISINGGAYTTYTSPAVIPNLSAATYNYVVRDANNCTVSGSETVALTTSIVGTYTFTNIICGQVEAALTPSGGTPPYLIVNVAGGPVLQTFGAPVTIYSGGNYMITDNNGCSKVILVGFPEGGVFPINATTTDVLCHGSSTGTLTINFGPTSQQVRINDGPFSLYYSTAVFTGLAAGEYTYTIGDFCSVQVGFASVGSPLPIMVTNSHTDVLCNQPSTGTITIRVSGGTSPYQVEFPGREISIISSPTAELVYSGLTPGTYNYLIRDANNCTAVASETVGSQSCVNEGCGPGFWKNHEELWDNTNDPVIANISALGGQMFTSNTPVATLFGFSPAGYPAGITMRGMIAQGGGQCKAFGRHAVSALLSSASGLNIDYPDGATDYITLYNLIRQALLTGTCSGPLAAQLAQISEADHGNCGEVIPVLAGRGAPREVQAPGKADGLSVNTYPNPFKDVISFKIQSAMSGKAVLDIYNLRGQKIKTVYQGNLVAGKLQSIEYNVPLQNRETLVYRLTVDGKTATGKILYIN